MKPLNVLITGTASGIGKAAADCFLQQGHFVWGIDAVPSAVRENFRSFTADVTDEAAVSAIAGELRQQGVTLDCILCVAGVHGMVSLVESDYAAMKRLVDVNLSGTMLVNRVFHERLAPGGRIIIVTSEVAGFAPLPFNGLYSAVKKAMDAYAHALRQEVNLLGQKVITVRPGAVETPLSRRSVEATRELAEKTKLYEKQAKNFAAIAAAFMGKPIKPETLAALIYKAATAARPKLTYKKHHNLGLVLLSLLPLRWQCGIVKLLLRINIKETGK